MLPQQISMAALNVCKPSLLWPYPTKHLTRPPMYPPTRKNHPIQHSVVGCRCGPYCHWTATQPAKPACWLAYPTPIGKVSAQADKNQPNRDQSAPNWATEQFWSRGRLTFAWATAATLHQAVLALVTSWENCRVETSVGPQMLASVLSAVYQRPNDWRSLNALLFDCGCPLTGCRSVLVVVQEVYCGM